MRSLTGCCTWALIEAGDMRDGVVNSAARRGIRLLLAHQQPDGLWQDEHNQGVLMPNVGYYYNTTFSTYMVLEALGAYKSTSIASPSRASQTPRDTAREPRTLGARRPFARGARRAPLRRERIHGRSAVSSGKIQDLRRFILRDRGPRRRALPRRVDARPPRSIRAWCSRARRTSNDTRSSTCADTAGRGSLPKLRRAESQRSASSAPTTDGATPSTELGSTRAARATRSCARSATAGQRSFGRATRARFTLFFLYPNGSPTSTARRSSARARPAGRCAPIGSSSSRTSSKPTTSSASTPRSSAGPRGGSPRARWILGGSLAKCRSSTTLRP